MRDARFFFVLAGLSASFNAAAWPAELPSIDRTYYEERVLPVFREHCFKCHSHAAGKARGGLVLDSRPAILQGGDSGPAVVPRRAEASLLIQAVRYASDDLQMPPAGRIPGQQIEVLEEWIQRGAPAPALDARRPGPERPHVAHWAFQPLRRPELDMSGWSGTEAIDRLIARARQAAGVRAVRAADTRTVARRLYLDLIGLPPTPQQLAALSQDDSPAAIESLVDTVLAMPEFGERWGRHWLDVARYADSNGCSIESNNTYDNAWRYRDYVIASWNDDKPYDQFIVEQIAGDLLDYVSTTQRCEQLVATGFLLLGPKAFGTKGFEQFRLDVIDEQIDTVGKATLGMSLGCARCHDHKFDPVSTTDYYALAGIFASTESVRRAKGWRQGRSWFRVKLPGLDVEAERRLQREYDQTKQQAESGQLKKHADTALSQAEAMLQKLREQEVEDDAAVAAAERAVAMARRGAQNAANMAKVLPVISPLPVAMAVRDKQQPVNEAVRVRGVADQHGETVPRRVLPLMGAAEQFTIPADQSGRLQLAQWLVDPDNGAGVLLARVAVNRIWGHLLARPLVDSVDNFGVTGDPPSHPELLDFLADRFISSGWSTKSLIRDIVLTRTYQLAAAADTVNAQRDAANRWLWRYEPKRIDAEVLRDSMLAVAGQLDRRRGGKTLQHQGLVSLRGDHIVLDAPSPYRRRAVYIPILRDAIGLTAEIDASMGMLGTFDFADPNLMSGLRRPTVVPQQALFLMNDQFVYRQARALAKRLLADLHWENDAERVDGLFELLYGRSAENEEMDQVLDYLAAFSAGQEGDPSADAGAGTDHADRRRQLAWTSLCQAMFGSNEFLFQD